MRRRGGERKHTPGECGGPRSQHKKERNALKRRNNQLHHKLLETEKIRPES